MQITASAGVKFNKHGKENAPERASFSDMVGGGARVRDEPSFKDV